MSVVQLRTHKFMSVHATKRKIGKESSVWSSTEREREREDSERNIKRERVRHLLLVTDWKTNFTFDAALFCFSFISFFLSFFLFERNAVKLCNESICFLSAWTRAHKPHMETNKGYENEKFSLPRFGRKKPVTICTLKCIAMNVVINTNGEQMNRGKYILFINCNWFCLNIFTDSELLLELFNFIAFSLVLHFKQML